MKKEKKETLSQKYWRLDNSEECVIKQINYLRRELKKLRDEKAETKLKLRGSK
jgi:hypothetical protein